ncbi:MAG: ACT domain-containing protein [Lysobacterales bacterium]|nr:MAG: ACT domain-containing protein [Xanthomonadales bacterium]
MKLKQISVFVENKPGQLSNACRALARAGINITTLSLADTQQFGILRLLIQDHHKAIEVLKGAGCVVKLTDVVAIDVPDRPGGLAEVLETIENAGINLDYMYAFTYRRHEKGLMVFRFEDPDAAIKVMSDAGFDVVSGEELTRRMADK